jgi:hypothetical protein
VGQLAEAFNQMAADLAAAVGGPVGPGQSFPQGASDGHGPWIGGGG